MSPNETHAKVLLDGAFVPWSEARLHVTDLGVVRGYGIFDFFRVSRGVPLFLEDYLSRFFHSAARLGIEPPLGRDELRRHVLELVAGGIDEGAVKVLLTGGPSDDGFTPAGRPTLALVPQSLVLPDAAAAERGVHLMTTRYVRDIPDVKTTNYAFVLSQRARMAELGANDVLFHDGTLISESSRSNVFVLDEHGVLRTPARNILHGITRKRTLELARELYDAREDDVPLASLASAREIFMTSTTRAVMPVTRIDGRAVGDGRAGPVALELRRILLERTHRYIEAHAGRGVGSASG